jgi:NitT/TauT family transport system substrate-binding protein
MKKIVYVLLFIAMLLGSSWGIWKTLQDAQKEYIRISSNPWIGFTPFMYAQEKGWLEETPFKFIWLVDLSDNARLFDKGFATGFTATQYELMHFKHKEELSTVFLIDQSYGADAILSNRSLEQLRKTDENIKVYLEMGSLNEDMFHAFLLEYGMDRKTFVLIDSSQKSMSGVQEGLTPFIIITYEPYVSRMKASGLKVIASTKTLKNFHAIDALFATKTSIKEHRDDYVRLHALFLRAKERLRTDPREFYETISGYLEGTSYERFLESTHQIQWIGSDIPLHIRQTLNDQNIPIDGLI